MTEIISNNKFKEYAHQASASNRILGTYIIEGQPGSGKMLLARYFAASALCGNKTSGKPCGRCPVCTRISDGIHPDVVEITAGSDKSQITVDEIRELVMSAQLSPTEGERKFFIIKPADKMNRQAQNALLKSIEEPPAGVTYLLLTEDITSLLPTVVSRAYRLRTEELPTDVISERLSAEFPGASKDAVSFASLLSSGSLGKARLLIGDGEMNEAREEALGFLETFANTPDPVKRSMSLPTGIKKEKFFLVISMINLGARDILAAKYSDGDVPMMLYGSRDEALRVSYNAADRSLVKLFNETSELLRSINKNVNTTCAVSVLNSIL